MSDAFDVTIVGGGIVGLATALRSSSAGPRSGSRSSRRSPSSRPTSRATTAACSTPGLYYEPGSLKARLCREGKAEIEAFAEAHGIPIDHLGKLVVAVDASELGRLDALRERAVANGVPGLEDGRQGADPGARTARRWHPRPVEPPNRRHRFPAHRARDRRRSAGSRGRHPHRTRPVSAIDVRSSDVVVTTGRGDVLGRIVVTCAGLQADRVAALSGDIGGPTIVPFRGDYYTLFAGRQRLVRGLIYPVPDPRFPFLGVHFTKRIDGAVIAGPNAVLAFAREGYRRRDVDARDLLAALTDRGFLRLAGRYLPTGIAELWRDWSKAAFVGQLQRYVPGLRMDQVTFGPSGVRAQALARNGTLVDDFAFSGGPRVLHVRNAPSPAATSSLAIGSVLADEAFRRLDAA